MFSIPADTILSLRQQFTIQEKIGQKEHISVWKMKNGESVLFALKIFILPTAQAMQLLLERLHLMQQIQHEHIMPVIEYGLLPVQEEMPQLADHEWRAVPPAFAQVLLKAAQSTSTSNAEVSQNADIAANPATTDSQSNTTATNNSMQTRIGANLAVFMIMPYAEKNILELEESDDLKRMDIALQLCLAMRKIHNYYVQNAVTTRMEPFFHGNLHPSNIRILHKGKKLTLKVADLGLDAETSVHEYLAPEQANKSDMDFRVDLYAIGRLLEQFLYHLPADAQLLLQELQNHDPAQRPNLGKLVTSLWYERKRICNHQLAQTLYFLGVNLYNSEHFQYALLDFDKAVQLDPGLVAAWSYQGDTLQELGKYDLAIESYNKAIALDSNNALAYEKRGAIYGEQENYPQAIADLQKAIELDPTAISAYGSLGLVYSKMKNWEKAVEQFNQLILQHQDFANAYIDRADALVELARYEEAAQDYQRAALLSAAPEIAQKIEELNHRRAAKTE